MSHPEAESCQLQQLFAAFLLLLSQFSNLLGVGAEGVGRLAVEQQIQLAAYRPHQLPAHGRSEGFQSSGVNGHGSDRGRCGDME